MQHLQPNTTLQGGKYRIERVLGQGGFGITYLAVQTSLERNVAIKEFFMKDFCSRDNTMMTTGSAKIVEQCRKKFFKEARNLARLSHPNIIGVIDVFEENETVYYVMPYLTGGSLEDYVRTHGVRSESEAMKCVRQIASALKYMHEEQHICHYDVKPANILLDNKRNAVLIDFGISKNYDASGHETTTTPIGMSEGYAPIEQYQQNVEEFSPVSDVYALGATLYFLLHGKRPVSAVHRAGGTELMISERLSLEIKDLINSTMQVSKLERAKSVDVFLKEVSISEKCTNSNVESVAKDEETLIASEETERDRSFEMLLKRAEEGDAEAQNELGDSYYFGEKVKENKEQAFIWYKKAAEKGNADAQYSLGWCYENGEGVEKDEKKAFECYVRSSGKGCVDAQYQIGSCYENGVGVNEDMRHAFCWYRKAAEKGHADAQYSLGWCYENGEGVEKDDSSAFKWYRKSAEQGNPDAQYNLGYCYDNGIGVEENKQNAFILYKMAAGQGYADAQRKVGWCYENGEGVEKDDSSAFWWYRKAAEQGDAGAQYSLGCCYDNGKGVEKDKGKAFQLYMKAAEQGNIDAQFCLGYCFEKGEGIEEDKKEAYKWYKKAAEQGNAGARGALYNMKLEDYEEFPLINEALQQYGYYKWERARDIIGKIGVEGLIMVFFIGFVLFSLESDKDLTFLCFIDDIPTYYVVIFFIIFNPLTAIILGFIFNGYIKSNQIVIFDAVIDRLEIEVPYPVREEFTSRFSIFSIL